MTGLEGAGSQVGVCGVWPVHLWLYCDLAVSGVCGVGAHMGAGFALRCCLPASVGRAERRVPALVRSGPAGTFPARGRSADWVDRARVVAGAMMGAQTASGRLGRLLGGHVISSEAVPPAPSAGQSSSFRSSAGVRSACRRIELRVPRLMVPCWGITTTRPIGTAIDGMAALGPQVGEADGLQGPRDPANRQVRRLGSRGAGQLEGGDQGRAGDKPGRVIYLVQVQLNGLSEIGQGLIDRR